MEEICGSITALKNELFSYNAKLVAVSKKKPASLVKQAFDCGQNIFGENYIQELVSKYEELSKEIEWHFIGHLQSNKIKMIAPFVSLIHGVDSFKLLDALNKEASKCNRIVDVLLQIYIAAEDTKFGLTYSETEDLLSHVALKNLQNIRITGLMAMATNTDNANQIRFEFKELKSFYDQCKSLNAFNINFNTLSMGMSSDYKIALDEGSTLVRIGSLIFGSR